MNLIPVIARAGSSEACVVGAMNKFERSRSGAAQCDRALFGASCPHARMVPLAERGNLVRSVARPTSPFSRFSCPLLPGGTAPVRSHQ